MWSRKTIATLTFVTMAAGMAPATAEEAGATMTPSEALHEMIAYRLANPKGTPQEFGGSLLQKTKQAGLRPEEEVALSFVQFLAFMPKEASALAERHMGRRDLAGRLAWIIQSRMLFRAFQKNEEARALLPRFREQFTPTPEDLIYSSWMAFDAADVYREEGQFQKAAATILEDLGTVPLDRPYRTFDALGQLYEVFEKSGQQAVAISWMRKHRDALQGWLSKSRSSGGAPTVPNDVTSAHRAGVFHFFPFPGGVVEDAPGFDRQRFLQQVAAAQVAKFDRWIAAAEKGEKLPPNL